MAYPHSYLSAGQHTLVATPWWQTLMVLVGLLGGYLTLVGWVSNRSPATTTTSAGRSHDLSHAA